MDNIDDGDGCRTFMVNRSMKHTSTTTMSEKVHVPIIILDDDDIKIDEGYKLFLDHLRDEKPMKMKTTGFEGKNSRAARLDRERIQRENRLAQRRKRKFAELLDIKEENIQPDKKAMKTLVPKVETSTDVQGDNIGRKIADSKAESLRKEAIERDRRIAERRMKKFLDETKAVETSRDVPVERVNRNKDPKAVDETLRDAPPVRVNGAKELKAVDETMRKFVPLRKGNKRVYVEAKKKNEEESVAVVDKDYMSYLTWLVDCLKDLTTEPMENPQNELPEVDPPSMDTQQETTTVPEKDLLVNVKDEPDLEPWTDYIIAVSDTPFSDVFVASKSEKVIDADKESTEAEIRTSSTWFKKLMDVLEKPYDKKELSMLSGRVSMKKPVIRCRELRYGREKSYETDELRKSYLEKFADGDDDHDSFNKEYERVDGDGKARLELLRGFFFYLENISQEGAFKPWLPKNRKVMLETIRRS